MFSLPYTVERSIVISKSAHEIFPYVADLHRWLKWSPFFCLEPDLDLEIAGTAGRLGHSQKWSGKVIGSGQMSLSAVAPDHKIEFDLEFFKPFKSRSQPTFAFKPEGTGTRVTWTMKGSIPFFLFFLRGMMASYIGADFVRGLSMLKETLEKGSVPSKIDIKGEVQAEGFYWVGVKRACKMTEVSSTMSEDFSRLFALVEKGELPKPSFCLSFTRKWDFAKGAAEYTAALAYLSAPDVPAAASLESGEVPKHTAYRVDHIGSYRFLSNGWSALMARQRAFKLKQDNSITIYEIYRTTPDTTPESELLTELYLPLKK